MKKKTLITIITIIVLLALVILVFILDLKVAKPDKLKRRMAELDLSKYHNIMIVAHPDDESIFGGAELIKENYLVVCVTCGDNKIRAREFENEMEDTGNIPVMLGYTDKILFKRSDWHYEYKYIERDIQYILNYKKWNKIVTHNKKGEYGHQHHIMVHNIVTNLTKNKNLYVFNHYCTKANLGTDKCLLEPKLDEQILKQKEELIKKNYKSQKRILNHLEHIFPYEDIKKV